MIVEDPKTREGYVLVPRDAYLQAQPLFEAIIDRVRASQSSQDYTRPVDWNEAKNKRRCGLIDKKHDVGLSAAEEAELGQLQAELAAYQRFVAPRPLVVLELLEEALRQRAADSTGNEP